MGKSIQVGLAISLLATVPSCIPHNEIKSSFSGTKSEVKIMTLDPGHFHAGLVQKTMYDQVSPTVYVYAPKGAEVESYLKLVDSFNNRTENPTSWQQEVYVGSDFLEKMLKDKPGNVVVLAGNNKKKTEYIKACVDAGLNVLSDKPMCIDSKGFKLLERAFDSAEKNKVLLYDVMTERFSVMTILQKELMGNEELFGQLEKGTVDDPAVIKESVHHFFKHVAGKPLKRPAWFFDTTQQGEGLVDVTAHLIDMIMWMCFPEEIIDYKDIEMKMAKRWPTMLTRQQFEKITKVADFPDYLKKDLNDQGALRCYSNGEMIYTLKGVHAKVSVQWNFKAPKGSKDTHYSIIRGSKANIIIRQGKEQNYKTELYIEPAVGANKREVAQAAKNIIAALQDKYPGLKLAWQGDIWHVVIPDTSRIAHEFHFRAVMEKYLKGLVDGKLANWEIPNMKAKYYTTTMALELANK